MKLFVYRFDVKQPDDRGWFEKYLELTIKSFVLFIVPLPLSAIILAVWYFLLYKNGIYFNGGMEAIITCAWIPTFAVFYGLVTSKVMDTVWNEYKDMRAAIKKGVLGVAEYVQLRDERVSSLIYVVIYALSAAIMIAFMVIKYPCGMGGLCLVGSSSYLFILVIIVIKEIDNPCAGLWFIRRMPDQWHKINAKKFRDGYSKLTLRQREDPAQLQSLISKCQIKHGIEP